MSELTAMSNQHAKALAAKYEIIAQEGEEDKPDRFVLVPRGTADPLTRQARILDTYEGKLYRDWSFQLILSQGGWSDYKGSQDKLLDYLSDATDMAEVDPHTQQRLVDKTAAGAASLVAALLLALVMVLLVLATGTTL